MKKKMIIMLIASAVLFGGVFGFVAFRDYMIKQYFATLPKPVVAVTATKAAGETWDGVIPAVGVLEAQRGVDVTASVAGQVKEIRFESGQTVKRGDLLVRLDSDVEEGDLRSAQAELVVAQASSRRTQALMESRNVSEATLDRATADVQVRSAQAASLMAKIQKKSIAAPFDGVLGIRRVNLGQYLDAGGPIVNLQDLSAMLADFSVSQRDLPNLAVGQAIQMITDPYPGRSFTGTVNAIEPSVNKETGMVKVQGRFPNPDGLLRPGMFARVNILLPERREVVTVPQTAITYNLYGDAVFVIREAKDDKGEVRQQVERAVVEVGERRDGRVVLKSGVKAGDLVVTSGQLKLQNGTEVKIAEGDPLAPPAAIPQQ